MEFSLRSLILSATFVLWSLHSFYSYAYGLPLLATLAGLFIFILSLPQYLNTHGFSVNKLQMTLILFYVSILFWSLLDLFVIQDLPNIKRILFFLLSILFILAAGFIVKTVGLKRLLTFHLMLHSLFFFVQFLSFYVFNKYIDFIEPFNGMPQSVFGGSFSFSFMPNFMRAAGLYNEPGTYSNFIAPLLMVYSQFYHEKGIARVVFWMSITSLFFSFSTFGAVFATLIVLFSTSLSKLNKIFLVLLGSLVTIPYFIYRFINRSIAGYETGTGIRETFIRDIFEYITSSVHGVFFGSGNMISLEYYIKYTMPDNDAGLITYLVHSTGPLFTIFLIIFLIWRSYPLNIHSTIAFLILMLGKVSLFSPFAPPLLYIIFYKNKK